MKLQSEDRLDDSEFINNWGNSSHWDTCTLLSKNPTKIDILDAIWFAMDAWKNISKKTVQNCWMHVGLVEHGSFEDNTNTIKAADDSMHSDIESIFMIQN
ncbi:hypothetical protein COEREDRAFT_12432 [Coemansia reversa NRRL 1564]|uniref:DDE-1 domain-containing protein n=1 Tax=Coemansia reversa (strain ATCC 12441 / NRRL 1564) TaxID=763665 RepID=A0A2G5B0W0_COERN|nr:hypothetical protein COEREDRAFT_12432 [Coemansia reversa NRRL 1564]|eukprot:PIA12655.1 hypothetical protein COEREDRAFT_12432 [Coemansia reversa NRRL 1564]